MPPLTSRRTIPALILLTGLLSPVAADASNALHSVSAKGKKFAGPAVHMRWGSVRVTITVKGTRIVNVAAVAPLDRPRSVFINRQALPLLKQEVLQAQSATVNAVSGATMTSDAYIQSLKGALVKARL